MLGTPNRGPRRGSEGLIKEGGEVLDAFGAWCAPETLRRWSVKLALGAERAAFLHKIAMDHERGMAAS